MNIAMLLEMAASGTPERTAIGDRGGGWSYSELAARAASGAAMLRRRGVSELLFLEGNGRAFAAALFAASWAGVTFVPLNYRLAPGPLAQLLDRHPGAALIADPASCPVLPTWTGDDWLSAAAPLIDGGEPFDGTPARPALLLYTSGTSASPKAVVLHHRHLVAYQLGSVDFGAAEDTDATLVSVPPYHIAGVSNLLSNVYAGRRLVYLDAFSPEAWLTTVRSEEITHAMVVPTMLARITDLLRDAPDAAVPSLRSLAYGGARLPRPVLEQAMRLFAGVDLVNAYGLTETSSTIAILGPEDHRAAVAGDPAARRRLHSVGQVVPGVEVQVRDRAGRVLDAGQTGEVFVRGEQVSDEYRGGDPAVDSGGWFATRDRGRVDADGYLFVEGRADDTIIRGGENIAPAEIEDVLLAHPDVVEAAVVGVPDDEWGEEIVAAVVLRDGATADPDALRQWTRQRLRSSRSPRDVHLRESLPHTATGKVIRRHVRAELAAELAPGPAGIAPAFDGPTSCSLP